MTLPRGSTGEISLSPVFLGSFAFVFLNFGLPVYTRELGADAVAIGGTYTAFTLTTLLVRPVLGRALDRFGRRWFFASAFLFYTLAMLTFSDAQALSDFYWARLLQGFGAALMWVTARTIIADTAEPDQRGQRMGSLAARSVQGSMTGAVFGFTLLGFLPMAQAWQIAFLGYALAAFAGFLIAVRRVPETARFSSVERVTVDEPGVDDGRLGVDERRRLMWAFMTIVFVTGFASALVEPVYLIYLKDKFDLPLQLLAAAFLPAGFVYAIVPPYAGRWGDRWGRGRLITLGIAIAAMVSLTLPTISHIVWIAVVYTCSAVGWAMANPALDAVLADLCPAAERGRWFGYKEAAVGVGAAFGPLVGGAIYTYVRPEWAFYSNGLLLAAGAMFAWHRFARVGLAPAGSTS